jgi:hypothetical protein
LRAINRFADDWRRRTEWFSADGDVLTVEFDMVLVDNAHTYIPLLRKTI